jgi:hypothetical protein
VADVAASGGGCTIQCNSYNVGDARSEHETIASDSTLECPAAPGCRSPAVVERTETASGRRTWWLLREPTSALEPLPVEGTVQNAPLLSNGGDGIGWLADVPDSGPPVLNRVHIRPLDGRDPDIVVDLAKLGPASYAEFDMAARTIIIWRNTQ